MKITDLGVLKIIGGQLEFRLTRCIIALWDSACIKTMVDILGLIPQFWWSNGMQNYKKL